MQNITTSVTVTVLITCHPSFNVLATLPSTPSPKRTVLRDCTSSKGHRRHPCRTTLRLIPQANRLRVLVEMGKRLQAPLDAGQPSNRCTLPSRTSTFQRKRGFAASPRHGLRGSTRADAEKRQPIARTAKDGDHSGSSPMQHGRCVGVHWAQFAPRFWPERTASKFAACPRHHKT